jgi:hypothetical protein
MNNKTRTFEALYYIYISSRFLRYCPGLTFKKLIEIINTMSNE